MIINEKLSPSRVRHDWMKFDVSEKTDRGVTPFYSEYKLDIRNKVDRF